MMKLIRLSRKHKIAGVILVLFACLILANVLGNGQLSREGMTINLNVNSDEDANSSVESVGDLFYNNEGGSVEVVAGESGGDPSLKVVLNPGDEPITFMLSEAANVEGFVGYSGNSAGRIYHGPAGQTATVVASNGSLAVRVETASGQVYVFTKPRDTGSATVATGPGGNSAYSVDGPGGNTAYGTTANGGNVNTINDNYSNYNGNGTGGGTAATATGPGGTTVGYAEGPGGNSAKGISASSIPPGDEDLYMLKSEMVPPVCPACPVSSACPRTEKPPPCPACARCPEPSFECKKVPNYNAATGNLLPMPVLSDFSSFGM